MCTTKDNSSNTNEFPEYRKKYQKVSNGFRSFAWQAPQTCTRYYTVPRTVTDLQQKAWRSQETEQKWLIHNQTVSEAVELGRENSDFSEVERHKRSSGQSFWLQIELPGSIPGASRFSEKQRVWNGVHSALWGQLRSYLEENVAAPV
jgi:hypothetical protein